MTAEGIILTTNRVSEVMAPSDRPPRLTLRFALLVSVAFAAAGGLVHVRLADVVADQHRDAAAFHARFVAEQIVVPALPIQPVAATSQRLDAALTRALYEPVHRIELRSPTGTTMAAVSNGGEPSSSLATVIELPTANGAMVLEIEQDLAPTVAAARRFQRTLDLALVAGLGLLYAAVLPIAHRTSTRLSRQTRRLHEQGEALTASERRFRALVDGSSDLTLVSAPSGLLTYLSPAAERALLAAGSAVTTIDELVHPDDLEDMHRALRACARSTDTVVCECRWRHRDGTYRTVEAQLTSRISEPALAGIVVNGRDVTERRELEQKLAHQAFHDSLTSCGNRALLLDHLAIALANDPARTAVLFVDVDDFKDINDRLGHHAGDTALVEIARRLATTTGPASTVARVGGDEFAVILHGVGDATEAAMTACDLLHALGEGSVVPGHDVIVSASVGVALGSGTSTPEDLLRDADLAMYCAKLAGKGGVETYSSSMHDEAVERLRLETELRSVAERGQLDVDYQPIIDLGTGQTVGAEALVRWDHPRLGRLSPDRFVPAAERTGAIVDIGAWILRRACHDTAGWLARCPLPKRFKVAVNLSARQLDDEDVVSIVAEALADSGLDACHLVLEITETAVVRDLAAAARTLHALRALGVQVALDDFGTGQSSLAQLRQLPVDALKLDRAFVAELSAPGQADAIVGSVVRLAHELGLTVVAEGVETALQLELVRTLGCDLAQGFLIGRPVPARLLSDRLGARAAVASE